MKLIGIVAMTPERVIGDQGTLPWHLPADLAFFKKTTMGHTIIMGRKTFDSIGRPLPKRKNIVLTRDATWSHPGVEVITRPEDLSALLSADEVAYVIGGAEIYKAFLRQTQELLITHVKQTYPGDTWFPPFLDQFPHAESIEETADYVIMRHAR